MLLEIDDWRTVGDLQYRFNKCFSNLQLQLFTPASKVSTSAPLPAGCPLEHIRKVHRPGVLSIKSWFTCREVEQLLFASYGLQARVVKIEQGSETWKPCFEACTLQELNKEDRPTQLEAAMAADDGLFDNW